MTIMPIQTIDGSVAYEVQKDAQVELIYRGEVRTGVVEDGSRATVLTLRTDKGFRSFKRGEIKRLAYVL